MCSTEVMREPILIKAKACTKNISNIYGSWILEKGKPKFAWVHPRIGLRSRIERVYTNMKIGCNNKIYHMIVSFTDHYNAISIDTLPSKTKIGKD